MSSGRTASDIPASSAGLLDLIDELSHGDLLEVEERYVDLFDRGRSLSLHLFEHLHGESRDRGEAMVDLKRSTSRQGSSCRLASCRITSLFCSNF